MNATDVRLCFDQKIYTNIIEKFATEEKYASSLKSRSKLII